MKASLYEKIKTIILLLLVISSVLLTYRLWFRDHNLFDIVSVFFQDRNTLNGHNGLEYVYLPPRVLVNLGENSHVIIRPVHEEYIPLQNEGVKIIRQILSAQKYEVLDMSEWIKALSIKSVLFEYETDLDTSILKNLLNTSNQNIESGISHIRNVIVVQNSTVSDNISCYIKDEKNNKVYYVKFNYDDFELNKLLNQVESKDFNNYVTGFELKHKLLKDDVLLLPTDAILSGKQVKLSNEVNVDSSIEVKRLAQYFFDKLNYVKNIEYKGPIKTNAIQKEFVDRNNILRIYVNGQVEYSSAEIPNDKIQTNQVEALRRAVSFTDNHLGFPKNSYISEITLVGDSHYIFKFDYSINGLAVRLTGEDIPKHAIEVEVKGNVITSYKRFVKTFNIGKEKELDIINLKAIDEAITKYRQETGKKDIGKAVNSSRLVYVDDGLSKEIYPSWCIVIDDKQFLINSVNEGN